MLEVLQFISLYIKNFFPLLLPPSLERVKAEVLL